MTSGELIGETGSELAGETGRELAGETREIRLEVKSYYVLRNLSI